MCLSPLKGFQNGFTDSGKPNYIITSYNVNHIEIKNDKVEKCLNEFISPYARKVIREYIEIPCGNCLECRLKYSRDWANRMMLEAKEWTNNYFVTLTYDNEHLPFNDDGLMTLCPDDFTKFMKRLRKHFKDNVIRFFGCGEYGDKSNRPHYHIILYNVPFDDLEFFSMSNGYALYNSATLNKLWPYGHSIVADVSWKSCAYVARYVLKKQKGINKSFYEKIKISPEFSRMSRRPGIGRNYFDLHYEDIYKFDELIIGDDTGGKKSKPPRYFDKCLENLDEIWYGLIKKKRMEIAEINKANLLGNSKLSYLDILNNRKLKKEQQVLALKRIL